MRIVPLGHARVGVTEVRRDHRQRCPGLQQVRGIRVAQNVEAGRRINPGPVTRLALPLFLPSLYLLSLIRVPVITTTPNELCVELHDRMPDFSQAEHVKRTCYWDTPFQGADCSPRVPLEVFDGQAQVDGMRLVISVCATAALAACTVEQPTPDYAAAAGRLDRERADIARPLGATTYTLDRSRLLDQPGGRTVPCPKRLNSFLASHSGRTVRSTCAVSRREQSVRSGSGHCS